MAPLMNDPYENLFFMMSAMERALSRFQVDPTEERKQDLLVELATYQEAARSGNIAVPPSQTSGA